MLDVERYLLLEGVILVTQLALTGEEGILTKKWVETFSNHSTFVIKGFFTAPQKILKYIHVVALRL